MLVPTNSLHLSSLCAAEMVLHAVIGVLHAAVLSVCLVPRRNSTAVLCRLRCLADCHCYVEPMCVLLCHFYNKHNALRLLPCQSFTYVNIVKKADTLVRLASTFNFLS